MPTPKADPHARYRQAHQYGHEGRKLPPRLSQLADQDQLVDVAYDTGSSGNSFEDFLASNKLTPPAPPAPKPRELGHVAHSASSVLLGMLAAALVLSVIDYGALGPLYWFKAKFLNEPAPSPAAAAASSAPKGSELA